MKAIEIINKYNDKFFNEKKSENDGLIAIDNNELIELLNDEAFAVEDILDQETWIMSDGSYITRNGDEYWTGKDIDDFRITAETI